MTRTGALLGGMCMVVLALGPAIAHAQNLPENTPETCSDRVDNDGDGYVDCYDPDCRYLQFCQQQGAPPQQYQQPEQQPQGQQPQYPPAQYPPPQYPPSEYQQQPQYPPPQYPPAYAQPQYAPPQYAPPGYAQPMYTPPPRPPGTGVGEVVFGFIILGLGVALIGTSVMVWDNANQAHNYDTQFSNTVGGVVLDVFGVSFFVVGAVLIPVGFVKAAKHSRWLKQQQQRAGLIDLGHGVSLTPSLAATSDGGRAGLKFSF
jgi:hypothetical protein